MLTILMSHPVRRENKLQNPCWQIAYLQSLQPQSANQPPLLVMDRISASTHTDTLDK